MSFYEPPPVAPLSARDAALLAPLPRPKKRALLVGALLSLGVHLLILFAVPKPEPKGNVSPLGSGDLNVKLAPRVTPQAPATASTTPETTPRRTRRKPPPRSTVLSAQTPSRDAPRIAAAPVEPPTPPAPPEPAPVDLQAFVNAARARRRAARGISGTDAAEESAGAPGPSADDIRLARIKENLRSGTSGVFQILSLDARRAAFAFRGWTNDVSAARREYIPVDIGDNASIELAVVRRMIALIRGYYPGDFNWDSQRLGRVVVLSARLQDSAGLEDFLMREFFAAPLRPSQR